ncbi:glycosyltransferase family 4 protein [candidate division WOR-3 bacterium]|nr:glycosyltransferase family 4 protein [candidate division WOR-3 bacterium]
MKVAVVAVEVNKLGGVERYAYELTQCLGAELFASRSELEFHRIPSLMGPDLLYKNFFPLFAQLFIKSFRYEIIHSLGASLLFPQVSTALTSQCVMMKLLAQNEIFLTMTYFKKFYWWVRLLVPYLMEKVVYKRNIPIIAISNLLKVELVKNYKLPANRIYVIYPGVNIEEFKPSPSLREKARRELSLKGIVILFVGSQWGRKGLKFLLQAIANESLTLLIAGGKGEERTIKSWRQPARLRYPPQAETDLTGGNVKFLGLRDDVQMLYNAADIFVLPSLFDAFGLTGLEAMACGVPVIISKFAGVSEIMDGGGVILNDPRNIEELKTKILKLSKDKALREELSKKGREVAQNYSLQIMAERIKKIYEKIC